MSIRLLTALASLVLAVLGGVFLVLPQCAYACSCMPVSIQRYISSSEAVFSGEVVEVDKGSQISTVTLRASEVWKGPQRETFEVSTPRDEASCGFPFKEGQEYLVYAYTGKQGLEVDLCSETIPLSEAGVDLAVLGNGGEQPKDGGDDEALSDTSGGVSVGTMVGIAGLAMAASFLVVVRLVRPG